MFLKNFKVGHSGFDELRPDQLPAIVPLLAIGNEDAISQKRLPDFMELLPLSEIFELRREDGSHVVRVCCEDPAPPGHVDLYRFAVPVGRPAEEPFPEHNVSVIVGAVDATIQDVGAKRKVRADSGSQGR